MKRHLSPRFWVEAAATAVSAALTVLTLVWKDWIEILFGVGPDGGSGALEWLVVSVTALGTAVSAVLTRQEWRRVRRA